MSGGLGPKALSRGVSVEIACVVPFVKSVFDSHKLPCILTSITDRKHGVGSLHYIGDAVDVLWSAEWGVSPNLVRQQLFQALNGMSMMRAIDIGLRVDYDIVFEDDHFHIEFQPKIPAWEYDRIVKAAGL